MKLSYTNINGHDQIYFETNDLMDTIRDFGYGTMEIESGELQGIIMELYKKEKDLETSETLVEMSQIACGTEGHKIEKAVQEIDNSVSISEYDALPNYQYTVMLLNKIRSILSPPETK